MKGAILIFLLVATSALVNANRGCRYIQGECVEQCPEGTHAYVSSCGGPTFSERTCAEPRQYDMGEICDMSRCDCDDPMVKDESTGKCVKLEDCPKKEEGSKTE